MELYFKLSLQKGQLRISQGLFDVQRHEHFCLIAADVRDACEGVSMVDLNLLQLNLSQLSQRLFCRELCFGQSQPLALGAVDDQRGWQQTNAWAQILSSNLRWAHR